VRLNVPAPCTDQRTRTLYSSTYPHIVQFNVPAHCADYAFNRSPALTLFTDQRTRILYGTAYPKFALINRIPNTNNAEEIAQWCCNAEEVAHIVIHKQTNIFFWEIQSLPLNLKDFRVSHEKNIMMSA
jgi:hypothetical protein